jgi:uncharacterized protein YlzI (FlbEa/FlbD family)
MRAPHYDCKCSLCDVYNEYIYELEERIEKLEKTILFLNNGKDFVCQYSREDVDIISERYNINYNDIMCIEKSKVFKTTESLKDSIVEIFTL